MGFLGKLFGRRQPAPLGPPGFLEAVEAELRGRGLAPEMAPDHVTLDGVKYGLANLGQLCAQLAGEERPAAIKSHFENLFRAADEAADLDRRAERFEDVKALLRAQIKPLNLVRKIPDAPHRALTDDLALLLVYDLPSTVSSVKPEHVQQWGKDLNELLDLGVAAVRAEGKLEREVVAEAGIVSLTGQGFLSATHALLLDDYDEIDPQLGAIVAVPHRHCVLYHVVRDLSVVPAMTLLIQATMRFHAQGPGSISPSIYWSRKGGLLRLPVLLKGKQINFIPPDELVQMLNTLNERGPAS